MKKTMIIIGIAAVLAALWVPALAFGGAEEVENAVPDSAREVLDGASVSDAAGGLLERMTDKA